MNPEIPDLRPTPEVIAVVGVLDAVGKTTTAINLAVAFAAAGRVVLLIDLDAQSGIGNLLVRGLQDGIGGAACLFTEAVATREMIAATEIPSLYLLPADEALAGVESRLAMVGDSRTRLAQSIETLWALPTRFDLIIINCPSNLGLMTLNALVAAHWVLVMAPTVMEEATSSGISALLLMIQRLRDGMHQTLRGVYLLPMQRGEQDGAEAVPVQSKFGAMTLPLVIPWSQMVGEATRRGRPVLVYAARDGVSIAYLSLAAGWLQWMGAGIVQASTLAFPTEGDYRETMERRIRAWLIDPSCLLYDADLAKNEPLSRAENRVVEDLINLTHPMLSARVPLQIEQTARRTQRGIRVRRTGLALVIGVLVLLGAYLFAPPSLRFELAAGLIGAKQYWKAGSELLRRSDETAYRELILGTKLVGNNRQRLLTCEEEAHTKGAVVSCMVAIPPE